MIDKTNLKPCVIFDIDGTLADGSHRQHLIRNKPKNWPAYQKLAHLDVPVGAVVAAYATMHKGGWPIFIASGRSEQERDVTDNWLLKHGINTQDCVGFFMRPSKDSRNDTIIKEEILFNKIVPLGYWPAFVFDDRPRVVAMWRSHGIFVFNVQQVHDDF